MQNFPLLLQYCPSKIPSLIELHFPSEFGSYPGTCCAEKSFPSIRHGELVEVNHDLSVFSPKWWVVVEGFEGVGDWFYKGDPILV